MYCLAPRLGGVLRGLRQGSALHPVLRGLRQGSALHPVLRGLRQGSALHPVLRGLRQGSALHPVLRGQRQRDLSLWNPFLRCGGDEGICLFVLRRQIGILHYIVCKNFIIHNGVYLITRYTPSFF